MTTTWHAGGGRAGRNIGSTFQPTVPTFLHHHTASSTASRTFHVQTCLNAHVTWPPLAEPQLQSDGTLVTQTFSVNPEFLRTVLAR